MILHKKKNTINHSLNNERSKLYLITVTTHIRLITHKYRSFVFSFL